MAAKLGLKLWSVETVKGMPKNTMLVGADVFHNIGKNRKSVVGFSQPLMKISLDIALFRIFKRKVRKL